MERSDWRKDTREEMIDDGEIKFISNGCIRKRKLQHIETTIIGRKQFLPRVDRIKRHNLNQTEDIGYAKEE